MKKTLKLKLNHCYCDLLEKYRNGDVDATFELIEKLKNEYSEEGNDDANTALYFILKGLNEADIHEYDDYLARIYYDGLGVVRKNLTKSLELLESYVNTVEEDNNLLLQIGNSYSCGYGTTVNFEEAIKWFKRAYRCGDNRGAICAANVIEESGLHDDEVLTMLQEVTRNKKARKEDRREAKLVIKLIEQKRNDENK